MDVSSPMNILQRKEKVKTEDCEAVKRRRKPD